MNSLYQQLQSQQQNFNNIKQFKDLLKSNPKELLNKVIQNNPQVKYFYNLAQRNNQTPKELFYSIAKQKGVDPNSILDIFQ